MKSVIRAAAAALAWAGAASGAIAAPPAQQLAAACAGCHAASPSRAAIPSLGGLDAAGIEQAMFEYRTGRRDSQIMRVVASALTPAETEAIALFLARRTEAAE